MASEVDSGVTPSIALLVCFRGAGVSIDEIMEVLETEPRNVLFGEIEIDLAAAFEVDRSYSISTEIVGIRRKSGRTLGAFDNVALRYTVCDGADRVAIVDQTWIVARGR